jgi:hypothetical protein
MANIALGISCGLLACCVQSLGLTIQRKSHVINKALPHHLQKQQYKRPLWWLGFAIFLSSNVVGSLVQIASLPVVILAPLGAVSLLWNAFFAKIILGDVFSPWMVVGTLLIAGGAVLIAFFGIVPERPRSVEDLLELFSRPAFVVYFSILGAFVVVCLVVTHIAEYSLARRVPLTTSPSNSSTSTLTANVIETVANEQTPLLDPKLKPQSRDSLFDRLKSTNDNINKLSRTRLFIALSYASFSGIISGMCLVFAKSGVELLLLTIKGNNQFWRWQAWLLIIGLCVFGLLQFWYLQIALVFAGPTLVCPSAFCFYNVSSIVNGLVYFNQFSSIPPIHLFLVSVGIVVLLAGVWVVSVKAGPPEEDIDGCDTPAASEEATEPQPQERPSIGPVRMSRASLSESSAFPSTIHAGESSSTALQAGRQDSRRTLSYTHNPRLSLHRRYPSHRAGAGSSIQLTTDVPLNGPVSTLGPGFQIGLSPISPGFEIVPRGRRRRMTIQEGEIGEERERRRTMSESDREARELVQAVWPNSDQVGKGKSADGRGWKWWWKRRR